MKVRFEHISLLFLPIFGCVEPFDVGPELETDNSLEGTLIVEATITNVAKRQRVLLSRMQQVESDSTVNVDDDTLFNPFTPVLITNGLAPAFESNASVEIRDDLGTVYTFVETESGTYESVASFAAAPNRSYQLFVTTSDNESYTSTEVSMPSTSSIDAIYAERILTDIGQDGMAIYVDSSVASEEDAFLRYSYEETYKIIAPNWSPSEFEIIRDQTEIITDASGQVIDVLYPDVRTVPRAREEQVCFKTDPSTELILGDLENLNGGIITRNRVRFLDRNNPIIAHRYSILLTQYVTNPEAYGFYERLRNFSGSESVFSQVQPGPLEGNVTNSQKEELVVGLFEVATETSQRIYFNFADFFPGEPLPPYFGDGFNCDRILSPPLPNPERDGPPSPDGPCPQPLIERIRLGLVEYVDVNGLPQICEGPYFVTNTLCGDCNVVGTNVVPEFWIEE